MNATGLIRRVEFARLLGVSPHTLDRWRREGLRGVRLQPERVGGRLYYTEVGYAAWQRSVNATRDRKRLPIPSARERQQMDREADAVLRAYGMKV